MIQQECFQKSYQAGDHILIVRVTFTTNNRPFVSSVILLVLGQADVTAIRFFPASLLDLGKFLWKSEALRCFPNKYRPSNCFMIQYEHKRRERRNKTDAIHFVDSFFISHWFGHFCGSKFDRSPSGHEVPFLAISNLFYLFDFGISRCGGCHHSPILDSESHSGLSPRQKSEEKSRGIGGRN
jgi:hypothetical protein